MWSSGGGGGGVGGISDEDETGDFDGFDEGGDCGLEFAYLVGVSEVGGRKVDEQGGRYGRRRVTYK